MGTVAPRSPLLDKTNAEFIAKGISIVASSTGYGGMPTIGRVVGCRVSPNRRSITLLLPSSQAPGLLEAISSSRRIAVVFSEPGTHRTIQLKGRDATVSTPQKRDFRLNAQYVDAFVTAVCSFGYDEALIRALVWSESGDLAAVTFTPDEAFEQTPGPRAGNPLHAARSC